MKHVFLVFLLAGVTLSEAQSPTPSAVPEPLIAATAPEFSHWIATCSYSGAQSEDALNTVYQKSVKEAAATDPALAKLLASNPAAAARPPRLQQWTVIKTGDVREEVRLYTSGQQEEKWQSGNSAAVRSPFTKKLTVERADLLTKSDFAEFSWINKSNFVGIREIEGRKCLVFEGKVQPGTIDRPEVASPGEKVDTGEDFVSATAAIDVQTRMPVFLKVGEQARKYEFLPPPKEKLTMPPEFVTTLQQYDQRMKARRAPLSPP